MTNERKTEALVRKRLDKLGYFKRSRLVVEEQRSDNPRIAKLLKNASKKGSGAGYPEFIISSKDVSDFLIVIECKAEPSKHVSCNRDRYAEYAVDGALLYASYLSKEFDVLAIGVSGQKESEIRISHYMCLQGGGAPIDFPAKDLLAFRDYYDGVTHSDAKFRQDYDALVAYSRDLNQQLHAKKIKESDRSMLICGILVALGNQAFRKGYQFHNTAKELVEDMVGTVVREFRGAKLPADRIDSLKQAFSFMRVNATLTKDKEFVIGLIGDIDKKVNVFVITHKYYDAIGQFYVQFLRYANNDKGLGIVLTPPHIAELFAGLAEVNKKSVVFDNCCGTCGLLIAAMREMMKDAGADQAAQESIKKKQLIGIEFQDNIYALAVANMVIHGDGKTNVLPGDCFEVSSRVKKDWKPTVGLLNPPYKTKASTTEELEFVISNLEALQPNGRCVAIVPLSCAIGDTRWVRDGKRRLLERHTLEAVMTMPIGLFHDSKAGVGTCIMVFTAHKPHPKAKKTWFGYWRDDGFVMQKHIGRTDAAHRWAATKHRWLAAFRNREVIPMLSVMHSVSYEDEWCAEAYMEPDWSKLTSEALVKTFREYAIHSLLMGGGEDADHC